MTNLGRWSLQPSHVQVVPRLQRLDHALGPQEYATNRLCSSTQFASITTSRLPSNAALVLPIFAKLLDACFFDSDNDPIRPNIIAYQA